MKQPSTDPEQPIPEKAAPKRAQRATPKKKDRTMPSIAQMLGQAAGGPEKLAGLILDPAKPVNVRAKMLLDVIHGSPDPATQHALLSAVLAKSTLDPAEEAEELKAMYAQALEELKCGPPRPGTFIGPADGEMPGPQPRLHVVTYDGHPRYAVPHESVKADGLKAGMTVYLDAQGAVVLGVSRHLPLAGPEVTFLRHLPGTRVIEASVQEQRVMLHASEELLDAIRAGAVKRGQSLLCCPRREFAFRAVPPEHDHRHRFIDRARLPDVIASRDIGRPHWVLDWLIRRTRILLFRPDLHQKFDLRPRLAVLMTGPSGTGKTLTIRAFLHEFDRMLVERTGRTDLGTRVVRFKLAELLSEYLGRSDRNFDELFTAVHEIASEPVQTTKGETLRLPCVLILEEAEGIARRRGDFDSGVYDRIVGTLLQRLDDPTEDLGRLPLILVTTTNRPELFDAAMWRRLSGVRAHFTRLDRDGLAAVLGKKLKRHYPYAASNGCPADRLRQGIIDQVVGWLFSPNGDERGLVEFTLRDGKKVTRHRRHFLTGSVVEQAVSNAIDRVVFAAEANESAEAGLSAAGVIACLRQVIDGLAENLTPHNAADYVDLPEHSGIAQLRLHRGGNGHLTEVSA
jgi:ATP-dependent 26S proteasome regulatory subunit